MRAGSRLQPLSDAGCARQRFSLPLLRLYLTVELAFEPTRATRLMNGISRGLELRWLEPPQPNGTVTVLDVLTADGLEEHIRLVREWAADVWRAWAPHHETVRGWAAEAVSALAGGGAPG